MNYGAWLGWQIDYLLLLQNFRDLSHHVFDKFFLFITTFGEVTIPIIVICTLYWAINKKAGQFILWSYMLGFIFNQLAKTTACIYRPWILDSRVHPLAQAIPAATGYSFPSGHTAGATTVWGGISVFFWQNKLVRYICLFILICVMFSRNYVGVHTPQDVVVSFVLSSLVLFIVHKLIEWVNAGEKREKYAVFFFLSLVTLTVLYVLFKNYPIHYLFGKVLYYPTQMKHEAFIRSGFLVGSIVGWFVEKRFVDFEVSGSFSKKVSRVLSGIVILYALKSISGVFEPFMSENILFAMSGMWVQYLVMGLFVTCIYPFFIKKYNI